MKQPYNTTIYNTALYLRLSRDDELQGESGSIQTQRMMLRQYAAEHGLTVVDEYIDDGWSGTNFERPSFQRMIDDIEDGKINCVVTKDLSCLGRTKSLSNAVIVCRIDDSGRFVTRGQCAHSHPRDGIDPIISSQSSLTAY